MDKPDDGRAASKDAAGRIHEDTTLVRGLAQGQEVAWEAFFERYSGLIYTDIRRKLFAEDEDEVRTVFVDVLHKLHAGKIREYSGKAPLSAWLIVVARGMALDFLRHRDGRDQPPDGYFALDALEKEVFKLRYVDGLSHEVIAHVLRERGHQVDEAEFVDIFHTIERNVGKRYLQKIEHNLKAGAAGMSSGRLLRYFLYVKASREQSGSSTPMSELLRKEEIEGAADRAHSILARLTPEERDVLRLRFMEGFDAGTVAKMMRLDGPRRVYAISRRAVNKIRHKALTSQGDR